MTRHRTRSTALSDTSDGIIATLAPTAGRASLDRHVFDAASAARSGGDR